MNTRSKLYQSQFNNMTSKKIIFIAILFVLLSIGVTCGVIGCSGGGGGESKEKVAGPSPATVEVGQILTDPMLSYSLIYPANWTAVRGTNNTVDLIGQVTPILPTGPEDLAGTCKITITSHDNPALLPLPQWLTQAEEASGAVPPTSSVPITINNVSGVKETTEELGLTETVYLSQGDKVLSLQLMCGDDALNAGRAIFANILSSLTLK